MHLAAARFGGRSDNARRLQLLHDVLSAVGIYNQHPLHKERCPVLMLNNHMGGMLE